MKRILISSWPPTSSWYSWRRISGIDCEGFERLQPHFPQFIKTATKAYEAKRGSSRIYTMAIVPGHPGITLLTRFQLRLTRIYSSARRREFFLHDHRCAC